MVLLTVNLDDKANKQVEKYKDKWQMSKQDTVNKILREYKENE